MSTHSLKFSIKSLSTHWLKFSIMSLMAGMAKASSRSESAATEHKGCNQGGSICHSSTRKAVDWAGHPQQLWRTRHSSHDYRWAPPLQDTSRLDGKLFLACALSVLATCNSLEYAPVYLNLVMRAHQLDNFMSSARSCEDSNRLFGRVYLHGCQLLNWLRWWWLLWLGNSSSLVSKRLWGVHCRQSLP